MMNSYEQLLDRFDTFQKGMDGFGTVAGAYKDEILSACKDEISSVQKDGKEQEHKCTHSFYRNGIGYRNVKF